MGLKIIGAGYGRTGTLSLKQALEILGFGPCYHMFELWQHQGDIKYWEQVLKGKSIDWEDLFADYQSAVDFPTCIYYDKLLEQYPEAKVVLTTRDPEAWYESTQKTILGNRPSIWQALKITFQLPFSQKQRRKIRIGYHNRKLLREHVFGGNPQNREQAIENFNAHVDKVKKTVPANQLLVFEVKDGWEPLCNFLGVPIPDQPFPRTNRRSEYRDLIKTVKKL
jgi:hypothetical protein